MSNSTEVDPERLRPELDTTQEAMGLRERYPSQFQYWLLFVLCLVPVRHGTRARGTSRRAHSRESGRFVSVRPLLSL